MIKRIVRMSFEPNKANEFESLFEEVREKIRARKGCRRLELLRDIHKNHVFFTYSFWDSEDDLNEYRHSELFKQTWVRTKAMFNDKPLAWSVESLDVLD